MKNKKIFTAALIVCFVTSLSFSQDTGRLTDARVSKEKPTVFITFERTGVGQPLRIGESNQRIWLRLHNNTPWAIKLCLGGDRGRESKSLISPLSLSDGSYVSGLRKDTEYPACHGVEQRYENEYGTNKKKRTPQGYDSGHVFGSVWLASSSSVIFSVPREHIAKHLAIYLNFNYEWEREKTEPEEGEIRSNEPQHRVYFYPSRACPELCVSDRH